MNAFLSCLRVIWTWMRRKRRVSNWKFWLSRLFYVLAGVYLCLSFPGFYMFWFLPRYGSDVAEDSVAEVCGTEEVPEGFVPPSEHEIAAENKYHLTSLPRTLALFMRCAWDEPAEAYRFQVVLCRDKATMEVFAIETFIKRIFEDDREQILLARVTGVAVDEKLVDRSKVILVDKLKQGAQDLFVWLWELSKKKV